MSRLLRLQDCGVSIVSYLVPLSGLSSGLYLSSYEIAPKRNCKDSRYGLGLTALEATCLGSCKLTFASIIHCSSPKPLNPSHIRTPEPGRIVDSLLLVCARRGYMWLHFRDLRFEDTRRRFRVYGFLNLYIP